MTEDDVKELEMLRIARDLAVAAVRDGDVTYQSPAIVLTLARIGKSDGVPKSNVSIVFLKEALRAMTPEQKKMIAVQYAGDGVLTLPVESVVEAVADILEKTG